MGSSRNLALPEPLSHEEQRNIATLLGSSKWLKEGERLAITNALEYTAIIRSQEAIEAVTETSIALYLIREHGLYLGRLNELDLPIETWEEYLAYLGRRGLARSTSFKHLSSLHIFHKGLGRDLFQALQIPDGVRSLHHLKEMVYYDFKTGEILGPKKQGLLETLPSPHLDLVGRLNVVIDDILVGKDTDLELTPSGVRRLLRQDYNQEEQINFYWTLGPFGKALAWYYYEPDSLEELRGIVGIDSMPQIVEERLQRWARVTERDPEPFAEKLLKEDKVFSQITIVGNLGSDPEMRYTPAGKAVTNFSVATNRKWTNADGTPGEETTWFRITCWGRLAETTNEYLSKGRPVLVIGRMSPGENGSPRTWTGSDGEVRASYEVTAEQVRFLGGGRREEEPQEESGEFDIDELPF